MVPPLAAVETAARLTKFETAPWRRKRDDDGVVDADSAHIGPPGAKMAKVEATGEGLDLAGVKVEDEILDDDDVTPHLSENTQDESTDIDDDECALALFAALGSASAAASEQPVVKDEPSHDIYAGL